MEGEHPHVHCVVQEAFVNKSQGPGDHAAPGAIVRKLGPGRQEGRVGRCTPLAATVLLGSALGVHIGKRVGCHSVLARLLLMMLNMIPQIVRRGIWL